MAAAVKTEKAISPRPSPAAAGSEIVDNRTGEVMPMSGAVDALDELTVGALSGGGDLLERLKKAKAAKKEDFGALEKDFWAPGKPGTDEAVIQGVYIGSAKVGRLVQHAIAQMGKDGKPFAVRLNGGHSLTNQLKQCAPRDLVRIEYNGEQNTKGVASADGTGRTMGMWTVTKIA